ncbi:MAG: thiamine-phosphate kinase [Thermoleophilia bacterium]
MLVGGMGEEALLRKLRGLFAAAGPGVPVGIGDDAAVLDCPEGRQAVWSTDLMLEGVHFLKQWQTPRQLGRKCLAVNLSDIAAMGATPNFALLSIACTPETEIEYVLEIARGFSGLATEEGVAVVGGDTTASTGALTVSVSVGGFVEEGEALLRSGATVGDSILVTGDLGSAAAGLRLVREGESGAYPDLTSAFLEPQPRIRASLAAVQVGATSMTDISDGLASDLRHICEESGVGAMVEPASLPSSPQMDEAVVRFGWDRESIMLSGGEDYELLFTLPGGIAEQAKEVIAHAAGQQVTIIGEIMPREYGVRLVGRDGSGRDMPPHGYEHFISRD